MLTERTVVGWVLAGLAAFLLYFGFCVDSARADDRTVWHWTTADGTRWWTDDPTVVPAMYQPTAVVVPLERLSEYARYTKAPQVDEVEED